MAVNSLANFLRIYLNQYHAYKKISQHKGDKPYVS